MRKFWLLAVFFGALGAQAEMTCQDVVGSNVCRQLDKLNVSLNQTCMGDSCYTLWQRHLDMMRNLVSTYENQVFYGTALSTEMGSLAYSTADLICRVRHTGPCEWMKALYYAKVDTLYVLKDIQANAGLTNIRNCSLVLACP